MQSLDLERYDIYSEKEWKYKSSICIVENSIWLNEMILKRAKSDTFWLKKDKKIYKHFHFSGHDNYFDIIAEEYTVEKILKKDINDYEALWKISLL